MSMSAAPDHAPEDIEQCERSVQVGELTCYVEDAPPPDASVRQRDADLFRGFGLKPGDFADGLVVDIGAGPYLRTKYFRDAQIAVIEPLADEYRRQASWSDLNDAAAVYSQPAEQPVAELLGQAACVLSLNAIDHAFEPWRILANMRSYLKSDGLMLVSVDVHDGDEDDLHPVALTPALLTELAVNAGLAIERRYLYTPHGRNYGHGFAYTIVARPRAAGEPDGSDSPLIPLRSTGQLAWEEISDRAGSVARRMKRVVTGESRTVKRWLGKAA